MGDAHEETWETTDLATAAYLRAKGNRYEIRTEEGACTWTFALVPALKEAMAEYAMGHAYVDPEELIGHYLEMRKIMFRTLDRDGGTERPPAGDYGRI